MSSRDFQPRWETVSLSAITNYSLIRMLSCPAMRLKAVMAKQTKERRQARDDSLS
jgi:hypothetical protein